MSFQLATLRTFGNLSTWYEKYRVAAKNRKMQEFKNVINESLLKGDSNSTILSVIPLPELHLLMGLVNWAVEFLYKVVPKADFLVKMEQKVKTIHGYHRGGLNRV